jgi:hypothetical protein
MHVAHPQEPPGVPIPLCCGEDFSRFLRSQGNAASIEYVADIAELEMACNRARYAADIRPLDPKVLWSLRPAQLNGLRLSLHPSQRGGNVRRKVGNQDIIAVEDETVRPQKADRRTVPIDAAEVGPASAAGRRTHRRAVARADNRRGNQGRRCRCTRL